LTPFHPIFPGPLGKLIEVQTSVPIIWHEGPQPESLLAAFPTTLLVYLPVPQSKLTAAKALLSFHCRFVKVLKCLVLIYCFPVFHTNFFGVSLLLVWFNVLIKLKKNKIKSKTLLPLNPKITPRN
jgi:hypothetical protein